MYSQNKINTQKYIYTGERLKLFFQLHGISYKQAAADLHIDKNTVGKAVRGGNLNIDIILQICNVYGLKITDFFKVVQECKTAEGETYYISLDTEGLDNKMLAEDNNEYKKCEKSDYRLDALSELMKDGGQKLDALMDIYKHCQEALDAIAEEGKSGI